MKLNTSLSLIISTVLLSSCLWFGCSTAKTVMEQGSDLSIKESYVQKIVPGTQETLPADFLCLTLNNYNLEAVFIDSIYYINRSYPIKKSKLKYKLNLSKGVDRKNADNIVKLKDTGTVFYHINNKPYFLQIERIIRKETLYLP